MFSRVYLSKLIVTPLMKRLIVSLFAFFLAFQSTMLAAPYKVLIFSATAGYRHDSITNGIAAIQALGLTNGFAADTTEDPQQFNAANLSQYQAVIFLNTTGDVLTNSAQEGLCKILFAREVAGWGFIRPRIRNMAGTGMADW